MAITPKGDTYSYLATDGKPDEARMVSWFPASSLATEGPDGYPRLRVDNGNTAFFAGREFRVFYEFSTNGTDNSIATASSHWLKFTLPVNCILRLETISVDTGAIRYRSWRGGTDNGPWTALSSPKHGLFSRNGWAQADSGYVLQSTVQHSTNNAAHGADGTVSGVARVRSAGSTAQRVSVGANAQQERGVPAGTYYIQLENIASGGGASEGVYTLAFEERV